MNSRQIRAKVEGMCATTVGNIDIAATALKTIQVPVLPMAIQLELTGRFRIVQDQVASLMKAVLLRKDELQSLMPCVLNQAFSGQL